MTTMRYICILLLLLSVVLSCSRKNAGDEELPSDTVTTPAAATPAPPLAPLDSFYLQLKNGLPAALRQCTERPEAADSIAIAFFDSLTSLGDDFFDLYYTNDSLLNMHTDDTSPCELDSVLHEHGIAIDTADGMRMFKGNPAFVGEKFGHVLSEAGKAFFATRAKDQLQSCIYDDAVFALPLDTLGERMLRWDRFCAEYGNTYTGRRGAELRKRYFWAISFAGYIGAVDESDGRYSDSLNVKDSINSYEFPSDICDSCSSEIFILKSWAYHAEDARICSSQKNWLALVNNENVWTLLTVSPVFKRCYDNIMEDSSGVCISVAGINAHFLLLDQTLSPGQKTASFEGKYPAWPEKGTVQKIQLPYSISLVESRLVPVNEYRTAYTIEFIFICHNGNRKYFFRLDPPALAPPRIPRLFPIKWIGDLDGDKRIDVVLHHSKHNFEYLRLYLSGNTAPGTIVTCKAKRTASGD